MDCFVASLLAMTWEYSSASPRRDAPEFWQNLSPNRGRGECRVPAAPAASCAKCWWHTSVVTTVAPELPAFPHASGFNGLFRTLPGDRAFLSPSPAEFASADLTPASRHQDHTTSPSACRCSRQQHHPRPPHPAPRP